MAKKRRQARIPTPAWERQHESALGSRLLGRSFQFYGALFAALLVLFAIGVIAYAFYQDEAEKRGRPGSTAVQVEDTKFRLDYFAERMKIFYDQNGGVGVVQDAQAIAGTAEQLIEEEIIRRNASEFDITASDDDVKQEIATRLGITTEDVGFDTLFEQELARSGLAESEYRAMIEATVLRRALEAHFQGELPETEESVRYRQILVSTDEAAQEIKDELEAGGDFAALAAENSLDNATKDSGGEVSWTPRGVLDASLEELLFDMEVGELTTIPIPNGVLIVEMLEKDEAHAIEDEKKPDLAEAALQDWIDEKRGSLNIVNNLDISGDFDADKVQWAVEHAKAPTTGISGG
jgi:parvulin-like peptidyl-prolyl isomerase